MLLFSHHHDKGGKIDDAIFNYAIFVFLFFLLLLLLGLIIVLHPATCLCSLQLLLQVEDFIVTKLKIDPCCFFLSFFISRLLCAVTYRRQFHLFCWKFESFNRNERKKENRAQIEWKSTLECRCVMFSLAL